jgi:hypothetical protein
VSSWQSGKLAKDLEGNGRVILRLGYSDAQSGELRSQIEQVVGDGEFRSSHSAMQKLNPRVYEIVWRFP